jgi:DNA-binding CsgD family transcriptional regulator
LTPTRHDAPTRTLALDQRGRRLLDAVAADPHAPLHVGVVAPGGYGKTALLREIEHLHRLADVPAHVVDDAHLLDAARLRELRAVAEDPGARIVVAHRPWPRSAELDALAETLGRAGELLLPTRLDRDRVRALLPASAGRAHVDHVLAETAGVPRFVERMAAALGPSPTDVTSEALAGFRADLDWLDADVTKFLLAAEAGAALRLDLLAALLDRGLDEVGDVVEAARATGLLAEDGTLVPIVRRAVAAHSRTDRRIAVRQRLAGLQLDRGGPVLGLVRPLLGTGIGGPEVATAFRAAAREALPTDPALATRFLAAAVGAGTPAAQIAADRALAAVMSGDLDAGLRLADEVLARPASADRARAADVAATALAHRGQLARSTELLRWSGTSASSAFATVGLIGTGRPSEPVAHPAQPPTLLAGAASLMAQGVHESVSGTPTAALSTLVRASGLLEPAGRAVLLPDSPAALAALVALHCGESGVAESVLQRAVTADTGGVLMAARHRLLLAWIAMARGDVLLARERLVELKKTGRALEPRDWIFAIALEVGIARRGSDLAALRRTWEQACEAVLRHPVDLFTLLPLGEFSAAAARLRDQHRLQPHLAQAEELLRGLGNPPLWSTAFHWGGLHAAIIAEQIPAAEQHAAALAADRGHSRYCAVVSAAAESWLDVVAGKIDPDQVEDAARGLHAVGQWWDGARLAGQAAIRTSDRQAMVRLLDCARLLQGRPVGSKRAAEAPAVVADTSAAAKLSDREREVAALVVEGLTYKQIGDRLFISAKTVEHHVARMRQRLGCGSRGELLAQLRQLVS